MILLRDAAPFEILMVARNPAARVMAGVWVFPGGGVEGRDGSGEERLRTRRSANWPRRRQSRAWTRLTSSPSRAGSPRSALPCASTLISSWPARQQVRSRRLTASNASTPAGSAPRRCSPRSRPAPFPCSCRRARTSNACIALRASTSCSPTPGPGDRSTRSDRACADPAIRRSAAPRRTGLRGRHRLTASRGTPRIYRGG